MATNTNTNASSTNIDYPYYKYIKTPDQLGMSSSGKDIGKNFKGLMSYVSLLIFGKSAASTTGGPLGNRFFVNTYSKCRDVATKELVDRYIYIDNVPSGNLRLDFELTDDVKTNPDGTTTQTQGTGVNTGMTGLVPGILEDITKINPITIFKDFEDETYPPCHNVTLDTIDSSNVWGSQTHPVSDKDLKWIDPCFFIDNVNIATNVKCKKPHKHVVNSESFDNYNRLYTPLDKLLCTVCIFYIIFILFYIFIYYK